MKLTPLICGTLAFAYLMLAGTAVLSLGKAPWNASVVGCFCLAGAFRMIRRLRRSA